MLFAPFFVSPQRERDYVSYSRMHDISARGGNQALPNQGEFEMHLAQVLARLR